MTKQSPTGVAVAYANKRWAIMFPDSMSQLDQWVPVAQALMMDLKHSERIISPQDPPNPPNEKPSKKDGQVVKPSKPKKK